MNTRAEVLKKQRKKRNAESCLIEIKQLGKEFIKDQEAYLFFLENYSVLESYIFKS